jgi:uncharacterized phage infection (PIP) family protein YhgE
MNAIIREKCEAHVLTSETIEVHLQYLRSGLDGVQAALPVLRDKIDLLSTTIDSKIEKTNAKIEALYEKTNARIDALNVSLSEKIESANEQRAAGDAALGDRIDKLTEKVSKVSDGLAKVQGYQKALFWVLSIAGTVAAVVSIARTFDWI